MKKLIIIISAVLLSDICTAQKLPISSCEPSNETINNRYSHAEDLQTLLNQLTSLGVPGVTMAVYSSEGWWQGSAGFAQLESKMKMETCHLQYIQSISKTYLAVEIFQLYEKGEIDIDQPITRYLPAKYSKYISSADKITVRMLMNHTSGIREYNSDPAYVSYLLQHPEHEFKPEDYLAYIGKKPLDFTPGSRYSYRNTNYEVLALIADEITGDHAKFMQKNIFEPLGLTRTFYRGSQGYLEYYDLVNTYWDRYSDGILENVSVLQRNNVSDMIGDDGIVTTSLEAVKFLRGLFEGKLISQKSLAMMKTWEMDRKGQPAYGLGLDIAKFAGYEVYGHSGGGIGAGCQLYLFPERNIYMCISLNLGTVTGSPLHKELEKVLENIHAELVK